MKNFFLFILSALIFAPVFAFAVQVSVPSAPTSGYSLISSTTGNYTSTTTGLVSCSGSASCGSGSYVLGNALSISVSGVGGSFPFSADNNFGQVVYSTSTPTLWFKSGMFASSTSWFTNLIATNATTTNATTSNFAITNVPSAVLTTDANGKVQATTTIGVNYGGTNNNSWTINTPVFVNAQGDRLISATLGSGFSYSGTTLTNSDFTYGLNFNKITAGTSSPIWAKNAIFASSTISLPNWFDNITAINSTTTYATTTNIAVSGLASTTNLNISTINSALIKTDAVGATSAYGGTSCTNQFIRALSVLGAATCASVANTDLVNSTISGVALGSNLFSLSHDSSLTGTSYNGSATVSNWGLANINANSVLGNNTSASAQPTSVGTSTFFGQPVPGRILSFLNGQWTDAATTTFNSPLTYSNGAVSCATCAIFGFPWTQTTNYGSQNFNATTTGIWFQGSPVSFTASSTAHVTNLAAEAGIFSIGTTTSAFSQLFVASSTAPQITISDNGLTKTNVAFRDVGNWFYLATSSEVTPFATSTTNVLAVDLLHTLFGIGSSSPSSELVVVPSSVNNAGAIINTEIDVSTSSTLTYIHMASSTSQRVRIGNAAITLLIATTSASDIIAGQTLKLAVCAPTAGTAGTITWQGVDWGSSGAPTQTTTAGSCDLYGFYATNASSTDSGSYKVFGFSGGTGF